jgi:hypothetical protein
MQASLKGRGEEERRVAPKLASAIIITHKPLRNITFLDTYEATYHGVGRQHPDLSLAEWNTESFGQ